MDEEDAMGENNAHPGVIGVKYDDLSAPTWEELVHCQEVLTNQEDWKGREGLTRNDDEDKFVKKKVQLPTDLLADIDKEYKEAAGVEP